MRRVFADSLYWIAVSYVRDQWHERAIEANQMLKGAEIVTTEEVLTEFLAAFRYNPALWLAATSAVERNGANLGIVVRPQSHKSFLEGVAFYKARPDKQYSLTDCISMETMRQEGITEVLTHDSHFAQEGFVVLL
jgi:predicted nucleic acid-binding protein